MVDFYQLRYFKEVARTESISKAAADLNITQPALSKSIAKLEEELGVALFERHGKRLCLNDCGRYFQSDVKRILNELEDSAHALRRLEAGQEGSVRIAVFGPQKAALACVTQFMGDNAGARVTFEARQAQVSRHILHEFDIVFYAAGNDFESVVGVPSGLSRTLLGVPKSHPLAGNEVPVALSRLADESFIFMNTTSGVYERSYKLCTENGFFPRVRAVCTSGAAQICFIRAGFGVGFVEGLVSNEPIGGISLLELDANVPDQLLCFSSRPTSLLSPLALRFLQHAFDFFRIPADSARFSQFDAN